MTARRMGKLTWRRGYGVWELFEQVTATTERFHATVGRRERGWYSSKTPSKTYRTLREAKAATERSVRK